MPFVFEEQSQSNTPRYVFDDEQPQEKRFVFEEKEYRPWEHPVKESFKGVGRDFLEVTKATPETAYQLGAGLLAFPVGGLAGLATAIGTGGDLEAAKAVQEGVGQSIAEYPTKLTGRQYTETSQGAMEKVGKVIELPGKAGHLVADLLPDKYVGSRAAVATAIEGGFFLLAPPLLRKGWIKTNRGIKNLKTKEYMPPKEVALNISKGNIKLGSKVDIIKGIEERPKVVPVKEEIKPTETIKPTEEVKPVEQPRYVFEEEKPVISEEVKPVSFDEVVLKQQAEKAGAIYNGIQEGVKGEKIPLFTDNQTRSTFAVDFSKGQTIEGELTKTRKLFEEKGKSVLPEVLKDYSELQPKKPVTATQQYLVQTQRKVPTTGIKRGEPVRTEDLELIAKPKETAFKKAQKKLFEPEIHSISQWVRLKGGIKETGMPGEARKIREQPGGLSLYNNKTGKTFDDLAQQAHAEGFPVEDINTFIDILETDLTYKTTGQKVFSKAKQEYVSEKEFIKSYEDWARGYADVGGYSGKMKTIELPEMVQMSKELLEGKYPLIKKKLRLMKGMAEGAFYPKTGKIQLKADIFKDLNEAQFVLGHEIGHAVDWLPDKYLKRGNILGRVATLKKYMKNTYEQLATSKEIMGELKELTQTIKPFDVAKNSKFTKYRHSSKELYADAITTLINDPELLKQTAPKFYDGFFEYIGRKPEVKRVYDDIQELISNGREPEARVKNLRTMFERGDNAYELSVKKPRIKDEMGTDFVDIDYYLIQKIKGVNEATLPVEKNPRYKLEEMRYTMSEAEALFGDVKHDVVKPLASGNFTWNDFGEYLFHKRVSSERAEIANPLGWTPELSINRLNEWKSSVGEERFKILEKAGEDYQKLHKAIMEKAEKVKIFSSDLFEKIKDNQNYATYDVVDYIEQRQGRLISSKIYEQIGTLNEISNPATATLLKDISLMKSINRNIASKSVADFMNEYYPQEIKPADTKWNGKFQEIIKSRNPEEGLLVYSEDGKAKGFYVDKYIEGSFRSNPIEGMALAKILRGIAQPFRAVFTEYNPGFWAFNIYRDYFRMARNLPGGNLIKLAKYYNQSIKPALRSTFGIPEPMVKKMLKNKMLISSVDWRGTVPENLQLEQFLKRTSMEKTKWNNMIIKPFGRFFNYMDNVAKAIERTPKIASYKYLKEKFPDMSITEIAHIVRSQAGSPDFLRKGKAFPVYNNILLFSNAIKEGYRGDYAAYSRNPQSFMWKQAKYAVLPKVVTYAATLGLMGIGIKQIMDSASEYDKANYGIIPLGITKSGKGVYLRVPTDETSRFIGGVFWKILNLNKHKQLTNLADYMAGQAPTLNPGLDVFVDIAQYASGQNPYDSFRGRYAIPEKVFEASDIRTHEAFGKYIFNKIGTNVVYRFQYDDNVRVKSELEKVLNYPVIGNIIGRFIKISDYGIREQIREAKQEYRMFNARENLDAHKALTKIINGEKITPKEAEIIKSHPDLVNRNTEILLGKKFGNVYLEEFLTARDNNEKLIVLDKIIKMNNKEANQ